MSLSTDTSPLPLEVFVFLENLKDCAGDVPTIGQLLIAVIIAGIKVVEAAWLGYLIVSALACDVWRDYLAPGVAIGKEFLMESASDGKDFLKWFIPHCKDLLVWLVTSPFRWACDKLEKFIIGSANVFEAMFYDETSKHYRVTSDQFFWFLCFPTILYFLVRSWFWASGWIQWLLPRRRGGNGGGRGNRGGRGNGGGGGNGGNGGQPNPRPSPRPLPLPEVVNKEEAPLAVSENTPVTGLPKIKMSNLPQLASIKMKAIDPDYNRYPVEHERLHHSGVVKNVYSKYRDQHKGFPTLEQAENGTFGGPVEGYFDDPASRDPARNPFLNKVKKEWSEKKKMGGTSVDLYKIVGDTFNYEKVKNSGLGNAAAGSVNIGNRFNNCQQALYYITGTASRDKRGAEEMSKDLGDYNEQAQGYHLHIGHARNKCATNKNKGRRTVFKKEVGKRRRTGPSSYVLC